MQFGGGEREREKKELQNITFIFSLAIAIKGNEQKLWIAADTLLMTIITTGSLSQLVYS